MAKQDLTGIKFGYWTVLKDSGEITSDRDTLWECQCNCGTLRKVRGSSLKKGKSNSCGCLKKQMLSKRISKDITNQRFSKLIAMKPTDKKHGNSIVWECKCDCGNICYRAVSTLTKNQNHSCGCYNIEQITQLNKKNLIGQKFGKLLVLEETEERKNTNIVWKCQCDCGNITYIPTNSLTTGNTSSCGCITSSIGENNIEKILIANNINYKKEYTNNELKLKRFDFAILDINNNIIKLIEFDGKQHYNDISGIWNSPESLEVIQQRDKEKNQWAVERNIPLVRIPYWERDNITLEMLLGDKYLIQ